MPLYLGLRIQTGHLILRLNAALLELVFGIYYHLKIKSRFYFLINSDSTAQKFEVKGSNTFHRHQAGAEDDSGTGPSPCTQVCPVKLSLLRVSLTPEINEGQKTKQNA